MSIPTKPPHILILGAGIGGLSFAQTLRAGSIPFTILERDESLSSRTQGWALGLHSFWPLLHSSLPTDLPPITAVDHLNPLPLPAQACMYFPDPILPPNKRLLVQSPSTSPTDPNFIIRANRQRLRDHLATNLSINFNKQVTHITETSESATAHCADGTSYPADILIGADGVHSIARAYLLNDPSHSVLQTVPMGIIAAECTVSNSKLTGDMAFDRQLALGHSACIAWGEDYHLFVGLKHIITNGSTNSINSEDMAGRYYWLLIWHDLSLSNNENNNSDEEYWTRTATRQQLFSFALDKTRNLDRRLNEIIHRWTKAEDIIRPDLRIRDCIPQKSWFEDARAEGRGRRVNLIGDAAHPMTPFRGKGGVEAVVDACKLGQIVREACGGGGGGGGGRGGKLGTDNEGAVRKDGDGDGDGKGEEVVGLLKRYEEEMVPRTAEAVRKSRAAGEVEVEDGERKAWGQELRFVDW